MNVWRIMGFVAEAIVALALLWWYIYLFTRKNDQYFGILKIATIVFTALVILLLGGTEIIKIIEKLM